MKTFFRKLFNLRTDLELVGLLYVNYEGGYICFNLRDLHYKTVLTKIEHRRLFKIVEGHLEGSVTASEWCVNKSYVVDYPRDFQEHKRHRELFLASLYAKFLEVGK
jgi:hypothetical protein